jgi:hypothetical protein
MCDLCGSSHGHRTGCPEDTGEYLGKCARCGEPIYEGDGPIECGENLYCQCLVEDMTKKEILRFFGCKGV